MSHDARHGRVLTIMSCPGNWPDFNLALPLAPPIVLPAEGKVGLAAEIGHARLQFFYRTTGEWLPAGPVLDASVISDEGGRGEHGSFTGAFIGMAAFDTSGAAMPADFSYFQYERR